MWFSKANNSRTFKLLIIISVICATLSYLYTQNPRIQDQHFRSQSFSETPPINDSMNITTESSGHLPLHKFISTGGAGHTEEVMLAHKNTSGKGYWIGLHFSDEGTGAFMNLMSFLCLASSVGGVRVVEPFVFGSYVGQNVSANWTNEVPFSEVFDSVEFHRSAKTHSFSSLVPFRTFLKDAPRKVLIGQYKCTDLSLCRTCGHKDVLEQGRIFSKLNGFEMVGHACIDYRSSGKMTLEEFTSKLYRTYNKSEVVVLFPLFGGVTYFKKEGFRLFLNLQKCTRSSEVFNINKPSKLVIASANNYIHQYLEGAPYISLMVRFELVINNKTKWKVFVKTCLDHLQKKVNDIKLKYGIRNIALCLDIGTYGSVFFRTKKPFYVKQILPHINQFISQTVKEGMTLSDWDYTFTNTTLRKNPGFVAVMQKTIASKADVLVLLGPSSFQRSAESMFLHSHSKKDVIHLGKSCW